MATETLSNVTQQALENPQWLMNQFSAGTVEIEKSEIDKYCEDFSEYCQYGRDERKTVIDGEKVSLKIVDSVGGNEGEGEHVERVFEVKIGEQPVMFIKTHGFYNSYDGTEWSNEFTRAYPREVKIIQYFDKP